MATCTLSASATWTQVLAGTNIDAVPANNDTVALNGYALTFDIVPTVTGIEVTAVGNAGTVVFPAGTTVWPFTGWVFRTGTVVLCATINTGNTVGGTWWASNSTHAIRAITTNNGTLTGVLNAGSVANADGLGTNGVTGVVSGEIRANTNGTSGGHGCTTNNGLISGPVYGGVGSRGVTTNSGIITGNVYGGASGVGVQSNTGFIHGNLIGYPSGSPTTAGAAVSDNTGIITGSITAGAGSAHGIITMLRGAIITLSGVMTDGPTSAKVISVMGNNAIQAPIMVVRGANMQGTIPAGFSTIYHIGAIAGTIGGSPTMVELFEAGGSSPIRRVLRGSVIGGLLR